MYKSTYVRKKFFFEFFSISLCLPAVHIFIAKFFLSLLLKVALLTQLLQFLISIRQSPVQKFQKSQKSADDID